LCYILPRLPVDAGGEAELFLDFPALL
jgi:hypothetical protein